MKIEKAVATLDDAKFLIKNEKYNIAINRLYYSIFYMLSALSDKYNYETSKHTQLIGWFNKDFISNNLLNKDLGKTSHRLFDLRTKADYDFYSNFSKSEAEELLQETEKFISELIDFIRGT